MRLGLTAQHSTGTLRGWPHGEPGLCCHVQLRFFHPGWRLKGELLDQAREEDEELHRGKAFSNAVSPPCGEGEERFLLYKVPILGMK